MNIPSYGFSVGSYDPLIDGPVGRFADSSMLPSSEVLNNYNASLEANKIQNSGLGRYRTYSPHSVIAESIQNTGIPEDIANVVSTAIHNLTPGFSSMADGIVAATQPIQSIVDDIPGYYDELSSALNGDLRDENNKLYKDYYYESMLHQIQGAENAMKFSADQADISRSWSEYMSNTAYQRAVADMKKAGLNPMLLATKGFAPASTPSSASPAGVNVGSVNGQLDTNSYSVQAFGNILNSATQLIGSIAKAIGEIIPG